MNENFVENCPTNKRLNHKFNYHQQKRTKLRSVFFIQLLLSIFIINKTTNKTKQIFPFSGENDFIVDYIYIHARQRYHNEHNHYPPKKKQFRLIFLFQHKNPICVQVVVSYEQQFIWRSIQRKSIKEGVCNFVTTYFTSLHHDHGFSIHPNAAHP